MTLRNLFGRTGRGLMAGAAILAAVALTSSARPADAGGGWHGGGLARVPRWGSGWARLRSALHLAPPRTHTITLLLPALRLLRPGAGILLPADFGLSADLVLSPEKLLGPLL